MAQDRRDIFFDPSLIVDAVASPTCMPKEMTACSDIHVVHPDTFRAAVNRQRKFPAKPNVQNHQQPV